MILVSKFMVHRALSDKTYLSLGLLSPLIDSEIYVSFKISSQAKGTNSPLRSLRVRNEVDLVPLDCEDAFQALKINVNFSSPNQLQ